MDSLMGTISEPEDDEMMELEGAVLVPCDLAEEDNGSSAAGKVISALQSGTPLSPDTPMHTFAQDYNAVFTGLNQYKATVLHESDKFKAAGCFRGIGAATLKLIVDPDVRNGLVCMKHVIEVILSLHYHLNMDMFMGSTPEGPTSAMFVIAEYYTRYRQTMNTPNRLQIDVEILSAVISVLDHSATPPGGNRLPHYFPTLFGDLHRRGIRAKDTTGKSDMKSLLVLTSLAFQSDEDFVPFLGMLTRDDAKFGKCFQGLAQIIFGSSKWKCVHDISVIHRSTKNAMGFRNNMLKKGMSKYLFPTALKMLCTNVLFEMCCFGFQQSCEWLVRGCGAGNTAGTAGALLSQTIVHLRDDFMQGMLAGINSPEDQRKLFQLNFGYITYCKFLAVQLEEVTMNHPTPVQQPDTDTELEDFVDTEMVENMERLKRCLDDLHPDLMRITDCVSEFAREERLDMLSQPNDIA